MVDEVFYFVFKGAPTAMEQSCPGWPWGGLVPGVTWVGTCMGSGLGVWVVWVPGTAAGAVAGLAFKSGAGAAFKGAPTGTAQLWPGWPWAGFTFAVAPASPAWVAAGAVGNKGAPG
jgi:hypothetical protein